MLLRTSVVIFSSCRISRGSVLCQVARKDLLIPKLNLAHSKSAHRSAAQTASRFNKQFVSQVKIPFLFTVGTGSACLLGNQYLGKLISDRSYQSDSVFNWWHSKSDTFKVYWLICGTCVLIFSGFRLSMYLNRAAFMERYFIAKPKTENVVEKCLPLILSAFTHISPMHLAVNMYIFHTVANSLVPELGKEKFMGCYLFSSVCSGFASIALQSFRGISHGSVGASGAILGLLGIVMSKHPEYTFYIIFLPFLKIPAPAIFASIVTIDLVGVIRGWQFLDHAGHLGGLFSGLFWEMFTRSKVLNKPQESPKSLEDLPKENNLW